MLGGSSNGSFGLVEDVRYYGEWICEKAKERLGHLYPEVTITPEMAVSRKDLLPLVARRLTVIAWLWARTVKSPNPAFSSVDVPLVTSFILSSRKGNEAYIAPVVEGEEYKFVVKTGLPSDIHSAKNGTKARGSGGTFNCILSGSPIESAYLRDEGVAGRMGSRLMAIVAEGPRGRVYLSPSPEMEANANQASPSWRPDVKFFDRAL